MSQIAADVSTVSARTAGGRKRVPDAVLALGLAAAVVVIWEVAIRAFSVPTFVLPAPSAVIRSLIVSHAQLAVAAQATAIEILLGFILAALTGLAILVAFAVQVMGAR